MEGNIRTTKNGQELDRDEWRVELSEALKEMGSHYQQRN